MGEITPVTDHTIAEHLSQVPHAAALGMRLVGYEDGKALVRVPYADHLVVIRIRASSTAAC